MQCNLVLFYVRIFITSIHLIHEKFDLFMHGYFIYFFGLEGFEYNVGLTLIDIQPRYRSKMTEWRQIFVI